MKLFVLIGGLVLLALSANAQIEGNPDNWCREGFFTRDSSDFSIGIVKGAKGSRTYFRNDNSDNCPESSECQSKAYLVPGDRVVINRTRGSFACAWYAPSKGAPTVGWIDLNSLDRRTMPIVAGVSPWLGEWKYALNTINFTNNKLAGYLNLTGNAYWKGVGDNIHIGELDGRYQPKNGVIEYSDGAGEYDCRASLRLVGEFLIVADNMNCGGVNVSFSGVYIKKNR